DPNAADGASNKCLRSGDFLPADIASMNARDQNGRMPLDDVCEEWSSMVSGELKIDNGAKVTSAICPAGGCLGVAFRVLPSFKPKPYKMVNNPAGKPALSRCFVESAWMKDQLKLRSGDPQCGAARQQKAEDFCADPQLNLPVEKDDTISNSMPGNNFGE